MIGKEDLLRIARLSGMRPYQQEKHYIQTLVLRSIFSEYGNMLVFKGGTALWFFHGLRRFSEDLDFTAIEDIDGERLMRHVKSDLESIGVENSTKLMEKSQSITFRTGAKGPLYEGEVSTCFVRVEISLREKILLPSKTLEFSPPYADIGPFPVVMMDPMEIAAEKVRAIMTREKARDAHDLQFLLKKGFIPDVQIINEKLDFYKKKFSYEDFMKSVANKKDVWNSELANLIFGEIPSFEEAYVDILKRMRNVSSA